ncbi:MAG: integrase core domain-containing protein [Streptosporangiaceae bacterium]
MIGSCRRELLDRTLIWNHRHLMMVLREYEDFYNSHRPHRALDQAAPLRPLPDGVTDLDHFRVRRHDRAGGVIPEPICVPRPANFRTRRAARLRRSGTRRPDTTGSRATSRRAR